MSTLNIPKDEAGVIRLFAINSPIPDMNRALNTQGKQAVASTLLGYKMPEGGFEIFPLSDLAGVGLPAYLRDGHGVTPAELARDRSKLDGLDGHVLLVFSSAFEGADPTLTLGPDLTLIATYAEEAADMSAAILESDAAQPFTGVARATPVTPPKGPAGSALVVLGIIVAIGLLAWWLLS